MNWIVYLAAIASGAANPGQSGVNAELRKQLGQVIFPSLAVYISGLIGMLCIQLFVRAPLPNGEQLSRTPWWAWTGELLSIASTIAGASLAQRLGSTVFSGLSVTAALISSVLIDHFGWIGFKQHPISLWRVVGSGLMIGGLWLISRF